MKLWIDDLRKPPAGYEWFKSVNETIKFLENNKEEIELLDLDHDAGDYYSDGSRRQRLYTEIPYR